MRRSRSISNRLSAVVAATLFCKTSIFAIEPVSEMEIKKATYKLIIEVDRLKKELKQMKRVNTKNVHRVVVHDEKDIDPTRKQGSSSASGRGLHNRYGKFIHDFVERNKSLLEQIKENDV